MRILVCEDQDAIRRMIETLVSASGHEVIGVDTGAKAVECALTEQFDALLLDLMLPGNMDGFEVCARIRADPKNRDLPIFVISALGEADARQQAFAAGATAYYMKPFSPLALLRDLDNAASSRGV
jgi:CheY-like chemotaxis protein